MRKYDGTCDKCGQLSGPHVIEGQWMCPDCTQALVDQLRVRVEKLENQHAGDKRVIENQRRLLDVREIKK